MQSKIKETRIPKAKSRIPKAKTRIPKNTP